MDSALCDHGISLNTFTIMSFREQAVSDVVYVLSQGPRAGIRARHEVPIPRPRNVLETRRDPCFAPLLTTLWNELSAASGFLEST